MTDPVANFFLFFCQPSTMIAILVLGTCLAYRTTCFHLACLCTLSMMLNVALKGLFEVPLSSTLHTGYAFPSGHTQLTTVFYGWIAFFGFPKTFEKKETLPKHAFFEHQHLWWRLPLCSIIIASVGAGLIHFHYHKLDEVLAAVLVGLILIVLYRVLLIKRKALLSPCLLVSSSLIMVLNTWLYTYPKIPDHTWKAYMTLTGLVGLKAAFNALLKRPYHRMIKKKI